MKIADLFRELSFGELSNLSISDSGSGQIKADKHPQVIKYTNDGLADLYSRFVLSEKELLIEQVEGITKYHLTLKHTVSAGEAPDELYIKDAADPFQDDLIKVLQVWDMAGCQLPLNDVGSSTSLFTPQHNVIQVPTPAAGEPMAVIYQAKAKKLSDVANGATDLLDQEFELPVIFENALQNYIAHKVFFHIGGAENLVKSQGYLSTYEAICRGVEQRDLVNQSFHTSHSKLEHRGFV
jgi:hypothetical protein